MAEKRRCSPHCGDDQRRGKQRYAMSASFKTFRPCLIAQAIPPANTTNMTSTTVPITAASNGIGKSPLRHERSFFSHRNHRSRMGSPDSSISKLFSRIPVDADQITCGFGQISRKPFTTSRFNLKQWICDARFYSAPGARCANRHDERLGRVACRTARQTLCAVTLRAMPCHRSHRRKPASNRAAVSDAHLRYPIESLGEALAEGIYTGHAEMPAFELTPDQIHDLLSYLKTLE